MSDGADRRPWRPPDLASEPVAPSPEPVAPDPQAQRREAYEAGYVEGVAAGRARAEAMVAELSALWQSMAKPIEAQEETLLRDLTGIALAVAEAVLRREIADGGAVEQVLAEALAELGEVEGVLEVELNPADASLVREFLDEQAEHGQWRLRENPGLCRGGVRLHTPATYIDASFERTLKVLLGRLHREAENALSPASS